MSAVSTESVVRSVEYNGFSNVIDAVDNDPAAPRSSVTEVAHHVLDAGVVLESVYRQVLAVLGIRHVQPAHRGAARLLGECVRQVVMYAGADQHPGGRGAVLAGVVVPG